MTERRLPFKLHNWWNGHFVMMLSVAYFALLASPTLPSIGTTLATLTWLGIAALGTGTFGHLLNDLVDRDQDERSGAANLMSGWHPGQRAALLGAALVVALLPWRWLPLTPLIGVLLFCEFACFAVYSLRPIRLKERGLAGVVVDALYGYVLPSAVALEVMVTVLGIVRPATATALILAWSGALGIDQILHHQGQDAERDAAAGVRTLATVRGAAWVQSLRAGPVLLLEAGALVALLLWQGREAALIPAGFLSYLAAVGLSVRYNGHAPADWPWRWPAGTRISVLNETLLARFQQWWHPLLLLGALVLRSPSFVVLAAIHLIAFPTGLTAVARHHLPHWRRALRRDRLSP